MKLSKFRKVIWSRISLETLKRKPKKKKIKQVFETVLFIGEANTLTSKSEKDFKKKKGIESIMRYMFPSAGPAQHPVFIVAGYN